jgi:DNA helicase II / ATP-dependent DNA helicase PcrA
MDISDLLDNLNPPQRDAVCAPPGHLLILAGAGSGKTRVLIHRIAWLLRSGEASNYGIFAVTFTNKAANEMRQRIERLLHEPASGMWIGTFHSLCHRMLRTHWREAGLKEGFAILDSEDQYRLIRRLLRDSGLDEKEFPPKSVQGFINRHKDNGHRPTTLTEPRDYAQQVMITLYHKYEESCQRNGVIDFAELLLAAYELLVNNPSVLDHYRRRFPHLLVDEFQDSNTIQYQWLRLLAGNSGRIFAVGDDDQSIYGWRGARIENLQRFLRELPNVTTIRLEQNYRSTATILAAANALIAQNSDRLGKELWTEGAKGERIRLYAAFNEIDEARFVANRIQQWLEMGGSREEVVILYRSNAQSRVLEEALLRAAIPYRIYGGLRFFERAEIKDAIAYLRLINNRDDDPAFERIINTPPRGVGERTIEQIRAIAHSCSLPLWQAAEQLITSGQLTARAANALSGFSRLIDQLSHDRTDLALADLVELVIESTTLIDYFRNEKGERGEAKVENLQELVSAARQFSADSEEEGDPLANFLAHASLEAGESQGREWQSCVQLMTLHSAKGLEFPLVFITGMEEGLFPHAMSRNEPNRLAEERRLCYVGMTRAMRQLYLTYAEVRRIFGDESRTSPSRFIDEIPAALIEDVRTRGSHQPHFRAETTTTASGLRLGQQVNHPKFGRGVITASEGSGAQVRVQVAFRDAGSKWLILAYARLEPVEA